LRHHQIIGVLDVLPEFFERRALAEDPRYLHESADVPISVSPVFQRELTTHRGTSRPTFTSDDYQPERIGPSERATRAGRQRQDNRGQHLNRFVRSNQRRDPGPEYVHLT